MSESEAASSFIQSDSTAMMEKSAQEIDQIILDQVDVDTAWEEPVQVDKHSTSSSSAQSARAKLLEILDQAPDIEPEEFDRL